MAGLSGEVRHVDARHRIIGEQNHRLSRRAALQRPSQPQGRRRAAMAAGVHDAKLQDLSIGHGRTHLRLMTVARISGSA